MSEAEITLEEIYLAAGAAMVKKARAQAETKRQNERLVNTWRWLYHHHKITHREIAEQMAALAVELDLEPGDLGIGLETVRKSTGSRTRKDPAASEDAGS